MEKGDRNMYAQYGLTILRPFKNGARITLLSLAALLWACGGGGGGNHNPPPDTTAPVITLVSHSDGQDLITGGVRQITVTGTVSSDTTNLSATQNGNNVSITQPSAGAFSMDITLDNNANAFVITASDGAGNVGTLNFSLNFPFLAFTNGQNASRVIGQADFDSGFGNRGSGIPDSNTLNRPSGIALSEAGTLYVADASNNRILGFNDILTTGDEVADFVIGQPDFTSNTLGTSRDTFYIPYGLLISQGKMLVAETQNNRVLIWNTVPTDGSTPPDVVLGQPDFTTRQIRCDQGSLYAPRGIFLLGGKLFVADSANNRVLVWNTLPTDASGNGADADLVLGQADFTQCGENRGGTVDADTLLTPDAIWSDGQALYVSEEDNYRVLKWNTIPTQNGAPADLVLGQADFQSVVDDTLSGNTPSAGTLYRPNFVYGTGNQLIVFDWNRVLLWNSLPTQTQQAADQVLGESGFTTRIRDVSQASIESAGSVIVSGNKLIVADQFNNRILIFDAQ